MVFQVTMLKFPVCQQTVEYCQFKYQLYILPISKSQYQTQSETEAIRNHEHFCFPLI